MSKLTLYKGRRRPAGFPLKLTFKNELKVRAVFHQDCRYDIGVHQLSWNKLFGRTTNGLLLHRNSMRVGWRYRDDIDMIELGAYTYRKGIRQTEPQGYDIHLGYVNLSESFLVSIEHVGKSYIYKLEVGKEKYKKRLPAKQYKNNWVSILLGLYFGGKKKATHDMHIILEYI